MATPIVFLHKVAVAAAGGQPAATYFFETSDVYATSGIEADVAITKSTDATDTEQPRVAVKELLRAGILVRLAIEYTDTAKALHRAQLLVAKAQLIAILGGSLNGKSYSVGATKKGTIKEVIFRRRATYYI